jgi:hypothetical protein
MLSPDSYLNSPVDQIPALSQGILTFAYAWTLHPVLSESPADHTGQPLRWVHLHLPSLFCPTVIRNQLDEMPPLFPNSSGCSSQREALLGLGDQKTKWASVPIPHKSTVIPTSCKGTGGFTSHGPLGMPQKCHKADKQEAFTEPCMCSCRDMLKDHSTPDSCTSSLQQKGQNLKKKNPL